MWLSVAAEALSLHDEAGDEPCAMRSERSVRTGHGVGELGNRLSAPRAPISLAGCHGLHTTPPALER
jgi:hypothetical protein